MVYNLFNVGWYDINHMFLSCKRLPVVWHPPHISNQTCLTQIFQKKIWNIIVQLTASPWKLSGNFHLAPTFCIQNVIISFSSFSFTLLSTLKTSFVLLCVNLSLIAIAIAGEILSWTPCRMSGMEKTQGVIDRQSRCNILKYFSRQRIYLERSQTFLF